MLHHLRPVDDLGGGEDRAGLKGGLGDQEQELAVDHRAHAGFARQDAVGDPRAALVDQGQGAVHGREQSEQDGHRAGVVNDGPAALLGALDSLAVEHAAQIAGLALGQVGAKLILRIGDVGLLIVSKWTHRRCDVGQGSGQQHVGHGADHGLLHPRLGERTGDGAAGVGEDQDRGASRAELAADHQAGVEQPRVHLATHLGQRARGDDLGAQGGVAGQRLSQARRRRRVGDVGDRDAELDVLARAAGEYRREDQEHQRRQEKRHDQRAPVAPELERHDPEHGDVHAARLSSAIRLNRFCSEGWRMRISRTDRPSALRRASMRAAAA